ncbi:holin family protein [Acidimangrovimonas sediminis]|uniref:holin family protein n=1 Tax=Acidimangrovimonas sediminis TaxID=2056283 RepID=UPI000C809B76|nr:holin family protein [Acidimangrovimonas sediminis]
MGMIGKLLGSAGATTALGNAAKGMAEVFTPNKTTKMELSQAALAAALQQAGAEFTAPRSGRFDDLVNALNRLPRPMLALGTLGLFGYAMVDPAGFGLRMTGLQAVPEPLWWLLGAIVSFYFGAREAHYFRLGKPVTGAGAAAATGARLPEAPNAALAEWRAGR